MIGYLKVTKTQVENKHLLTRKDILGKETNDTALRHYTCVREVWWLPLCGWFCVLLCFLGFLHSIHKHEQLENGGNYFKQSLFPYLTIN